MTTYTILNKQKITHKWILKDFKHYLNYYEKIQKDHTLLSSHFPVNANNNKEQFYLMLYFNNTEKGKKRGWLSFFLCWKKFDTPVPLECNLYILNHKKEKYKELQLTTISEAKSNDWGFSKYCGKDELLNKKEELMPNNTLTLGCDLIIYEDSVNISTAYQTKLNFSMEDQFNKLLESQNFCDFTFQLENQTFRTHKSILFARSPVFAAMLMNEMSEKQSNRVTITDIRPEIFKIFLKFIYTDKVVTNLNKDDTIELLVAAEKYQLQDLKEICGEFLYKLLEISNAIEIFSIAEQYNIEQLAISTKDFIKAYESEVFDTIDSEYFVKNPQHAKIFISK